MEQVRNNKEDVLLDIKSKISNILYQSKNDLGPVVDIFGEIFLMNNYEGTKYRRYIRSDLDTEEQALRELFTCCARDDMKEEYELISYTFTSAYRLFTGKEY